MNLHANAALTWSGRRQLCVLVGDEGWTVVAAAAAAPAADAAESCAGLRSEMAAQPGLQAMIAVGESALRAMQGGVDEASQLREHARLTLAELDEWSWIASFWCSFISLSQDDAPAAER